MNTKIKGGYYIKARRIQESEIAHSPPHVREIWDWLLREANHKDVTKHGQTFKRGQVIATYSEIQDALHWMIGWRKMTYSKWDCEKAMKVLVKATMITTRKTTRGMIITLLNYDKYQNPENYESHTSDHTIATRKPQSTDTINKNEKNDKERNILSPKGDGEYSFLEQIKKMGVDKDKRMKIIAYYWIIKEFKFPTRQAYETALRRELKAAGSIVGYENEQIKKTMAWLKQNADFKWTLETVHKYIDEPLENLKMGGKPKTEDDEIQELRRKYA